MSAASRYDLRLVLPAIAAWSVAMVVTTGRGFEHTPTRVVIVCLVAVLAVAGVGLRRAAGRWRTWRGTVVLSAGVGLVICCVAAMHAEVRHPDWVSEMESAPGPLTVTATIGSDVKPVAGSALRGQQRWWLSVSDATVTDSQGRTWAGASASVVANQGDETGVWADESVATAVASAESLPLCDRDQQPGEEVSWRCVAMGQRVTFMAAALSLDPVDGKTTLFLAEPTPTVDAPPPSFTATITALRDGLKGASTHLNAQGRGLVPGITVGDVTDLPEDISDAMLMTSLTHITAVSGAHFAILSTALLLVLSAAGLPRPVLVTVIASIMAVFVVLVRPEPSVLRAAGMGAIALIALCLRRPSQGIPALAATVIGLLLLDPWLARAYGFTLSVAATAGIIVLTGPLARLMHRLPEWLALVIAVPTAAQLACGPIIVLLEPHVTMYSIPANVLAAPAVPPATILGILALCIAPFHVGVAQVLTSLAGLCTQWITWVAQAFAQLPGASVPWWPATRGAVALALLSVLMAWAIIARDRVLKERHELGFGLPGSPRLSRLAAGLEARWKRANSRLKVVTGVCCIAVTMSGLTWGGYQVAVLVTGPERGQWDVAACDVAQGTAVLVRTGAAPGGGSRALVIDTGPEPELLTQCLNLHDVAEIEAVLMSHLHADHVGGIGGAIGHVTVREVWLPDVDVIPVARKAIDDFAAGAGVPVRPVTAGQIGESADGSVKWEVLWPRAGEGVGSDVEAGPYVNDMSMVVMITTPRGVILATGDLETAGQLGVLRQLELRGGLPAANVDVVVIPHHGSATQERAFADAVAAPIAIASAGEDNSYGHPSRRAIDMYARHGVVLSTHACGTITLTAADADWQMTADSPGVPECVSDGR